jgi:hypothetical protein
MAILHGPKHQNICSLIQGGKIVVLYWLVVYFYWSVQLYTVYNKSCYSLLTARSINLENESTETTDVFLQSKWMESDNNRRVF